MACSRHGFHPACLLLRPGCSLAGIFSEVRGPHIDCCRCGCPRAPTNPAC